MTRMNAVVMTAVFAVACSSSPNGGTQTDAAGGPVCGDGVCAVAELDTCPQDCGTRGSGSSTGNPCNLDGICEPQIGETSENCPKDCPPMGSDPRLRIGSGIRIEPGAELLAKQRLHRAGHLLLLRLVHRGHRRGPAVHSVVIRPRR